MNKLGTGSAQIQSSDNPASPLVPRTNLHPENEFSGLSAVVAGSRNDSVEQNPEKRRSEQSLLVFWKNPSNISLAPAFESVLFRWEYK
jgi:hypothetical protein